MRTSKRLLLAAGSLLVSWSMLAGAAAAATPASGLTITPATLTLELKHGEAQKTVNFTLTNNYAAPLPLHFAFETSKNNVATGSNANPARQLAITQTDAILEPHTSLTQTVTLTGSDQLAPGSQLVDLVVSQVSTSTQKVGATASIRMPLVLIKDDGAVSGLSVSNFSASGLHLSVPSKLDTTIKNTGNVVAIPHGYITISDRTGKEVGHGVLNASSQAIAPGASLSLTTPIIKTSSASLLGNYHATLHYGLGGNQQAKTIQTSFIYIGWQHIAAIMFVALLLWLGYRAVLRLAPKTKGEPHHRKPALAGRGTP